ncbi:diguanylate cyclase [Chitinimonas sp.]|uniref:sensor domain-containing diguanylate cyclase n=1 Tax=Chitinimonas sp. TaxID=1934313 RepID=UPI0035B30B66
MPLFTSLYRRTLKPTSEWLGFLRERPRTVALLIIAGGMLAAAIFWELRQSYIETRTAIMLGSQHLSLLLKEQLDGSYREIDLVLRDLAGKVPAQRLAHLRDLPLAERRALSEMLDEHVPSIPQVETLAVMTPDGSTMLTAQSVRPARSEFREYIQQLRDNPGLALVFSKPLKLGPGRELSFIFARRVSLPDGKLGGVVTAIISLDYFNQLARRLESSKDAAFQNDFLLLDKDMLLVGHQPETPGQIGISAPQAEHLNDWTDGHGRGYRIMPSPFDRVSHGYYFHRLENFPLIVMVGTPVAPFMQGWWFKALAYIAAYLLLMLFMPAMAWRSWREGQLALAISFSQHRRKLQDQHIARMVGMMTRPLLLVRERDLTILVANQAAANLVARPLDELTGLPLPSLFLRAEHQVDILAELAEHQVVNDYELKFLRGNDAPVWVALSGSVIEYLDDHALFFSLTDISERKQAQETLWRRATLDPLTGVANRGFFLEQALREWVRAHRYQHQLAVLMLDLDHFKAVNDEHGHDAGDEVLRSFADRMHKALRETDVFGRIGGEEFAVLMPEERSVQVVMEVAERLRQCVASQPFILPDGVALPLTVSIGCAMMQPDMESIDQLLKEADRALYDAKHGGRNRVVCRDPQEN